MREVVVMENSATMITYAKFRSVQLTMIAMEPILTATPVAGMTILVTSVRLWIAQSLHNAPRLATALALELVEIATAQPTNVR
jgi:hypothetical protein